MSKWVGSPKSIFLIREKNWTGGAGTGTVESDAGRCSASEDRLVGAQRLVTQHAHVCSVPGAVQSCRTAWRPGRVSVEVSALQRTDRSTEGQLLQE